MRVIHVMSRAFFTLFLVTRIYSILKIKNMKQDGRWRRIQLLKAQNDREIELISSKVLRKRKVFNRRNWVIHNVKVLLKNFAYQKI